jgi:hypothetical protein
MRAELNESFTDLRDITPSRALVPVEANNVNLVTTDAKKKSVEAVSPLAELSKGVNIRHISPRQMSELSLKLYVAGYLQWDEYEMLAFQPELHPDFDRTIGALTGETANPDRPRDYVVEWKDRYDFELRNNPDDAKRIERNLRILTLFKKVELPTNVLA